MTRNEILDWLCENDAGALDTLWRRADDARRENVGDAVHLRGLLEISNHCARECHYCGLRAQNSEIQRYRMSRDEILACAREAASFGYGTVVMQAGEDYGLTTQFVADIVREIKRETDLAVTLSLGERGDDELRAWRQAGADRYLLRFETSNETLYEQIHPSLPGRKSDRFAILRALRAMGYEVGSGVMIGVPGQSWEDLANDILMFAELDLDMIGVGPFIAHPSTPLGRSNASPSGTESRRCGRPVRGPAATSADTESRRCGRPVRGPAATLAGAETRRCGRPVRGPAATLADTESRRCGRPVRGPAATLADTESRRCGRPVRGPAATLADTESRRCGRPVRGPAATLAGAETRRCEQVPGDELTTYKVVALARLACPGANIPSTTALATLNKASGRELGLSRGANVVMPNVTPPEYRCKYEIYPEKACLHETAGQCQFCLKGRIEMMGRTIGVGRGDSPNRLERATARGREERRVAQ